ncbi:acetyl-CoA synthetase-like protein [Clavulina sp. PMI_390]|nr:acetyl-CoA synthetase-like protein [Clavulina sp. PMI_390]
MHFKAAVDCAAHIVNPLDEHGVPSDQGRVIAILAATDYLVYQTLNLGIMQSGSIALPISQRNSPEAVVNLLRRTDCHNVMVGGGSAVHSLLDEAKAYLARDAPGYLLNIIQVPSAAKLYPHLGTMADSANSPQDYPLPTNVDDLTALRCYIHSSGTTSLPKPIPITEKQLRYANKVPGNPLSAAMAMPPFHLMGVFIHITTPLQNGNPILLWDVVRDGEPAPVATPDTTMQAMRRFGATSVLAAPAFLVAWSRDKEAIGYMKMMDHVVTGGGPLPKEIGDELVHNGVNIVQTHGGTEIFSGTEVKLIHRAPEEWEWLEFAEHYPTRWEERDNGLFELQILESKEFHPSIYNVDTPDGPAYATNDLFMRHPTKPTLYKMVGRQDDQVTLATGEKVNPAPIELAISESPLVSVAVLLGRAKNQVAILVQPAPEYQVDPNSPSDVAAFRKLLWPHVENVNARSAGFAKIFKETIILADPTKPFARTPKGSVQRKRTEELYAAEIKETYAAIEQAKGGEDGAFPEAWTAAALEAWILSVVEELVQRSIDPSKDLFDQGADSLTATFLRLRCNNAMQRFPDLSVSSKARLLDADVVFTHPTISSLVQYLISIVSSDNTSIVDAKNDHVQNMENLVQKYIADLPNGLAMSPPKALNDLQNEEAGVVHKDSILITGTTGALGSALLKQVIGSSRFERVWALNRPGPPGNSGMQRQQASFSDKGLDLSLLRHEKVRMIDVDASADHLGLSSSDYEEISNSVTIIVHNAWRLDFNLALKSFEPQIKGTRNLIDLALSSPNASSLRFVFTSSIGVFPSWTDVSHLAPEEPINDPQTSVGIGYGESKYILEHAESQTGLTTTSIRIGQLSGSSNGSWATTGWFPILLKSSVALGCLPDSPGTVSWIPVDAAATAVLDAATAARPEKVFHIYHPRPMPWKAILEAAANALAMSEDGKTLPLVPFSEWQARLEVSRPDNFDKIPGVKLLPFYRGMATGDAANRQLAAEVCGQREAFGVVRMATDKMRRVSPTLDRLNAISVKDVQHWIEHWRSVGFLP